jgi:hypothetical protein
MPVLAVQLPATSAHVAGPLSASESDGADDFAAGSLEVHAIDDSKNTLITAARSTLQV